MEKLCVTGGRKLFGKVEINSAKNAVLPLISASIITEGKTIIRNCPKISDVLVMIEIIEKLGGNASFYGRDLYIDTSGVNDYILPFALTGKIRASLFTVGALISRFGMAETAMPGGCKIGDRPIDIHIDAMRALGVTVYDGDRVTFRKGGDLHGKVILKYPSVGATENAIMASVIGGDTVVISNAAREPEIVDLQNYLNMAGAKICGAGTGEITVRGVSALNKGEIVFEPIYDRIEVGTMMFAGAACGGELAFDDIGVANSFSFMKIFDNNACKIYCENDKIKVVEFMGRLKGFGMVKASPFPGFPTDLQPQLVAAACFADGLTVVKDNVFKNRFGYTDELIKSGACIERFDGACVVSGAEKLSGSKFVAEDLRGGAALIIAALGAEGKSEITGLKNIDRGYENIELKLKGLGADIERINF